MSRKIWDIDKSRNNLADLSNQNESSNMGYQQIKNEVLEILIKKLSEKRYRGAYKKCIWLTQVALNRQRPLNSNKVLRNVVKKMHGKKTLLEKKK